MNFNKKKIKILVTLGLSSITKEYLNFIDKNKFNII